MTDSSKEYRDLGELTVWSKNNRQIRVEDFDRVKKQVEELGQYKPILVDQENQILGGRTRFYVYKELGMKRAWVSPVECKDDAERMKYVLSDNDSPGYWVEETLAEFVTEVRTPQVDFKDYHIGIKNSKSVEDLLADLGPGPAPQPPAQGAQPANSDNKTSKSSDKKGKGMITCPECGHEFKN